MTVNHRKKDTVLFTDFGMSPITWLSMRTATISHLLSFQVHVLSNTGFMVHGGIEQRSLIPVNILLLVEVD